MTRKDYILLAEAIRRATPHPLCDADLPLLRQQHGNVADRIADALASDNPRFNRERFMKAAGIEA